MVLWTLKLFGKKRPIPFDWDLYLKNLVYANYTITCSYCNHTYRFTLQPDKKLYECPNCQTKNALPTINLTKLSHELLTRAIHNLKLQYYHGVKQKHLLTYRESVLSQITNSSYLSDKLKKRLSETFAEETNVATWTKEDIREHIKNYLADYKNHHKLY